MEGSLFNKFIDIIERLDRRWIYLFVFITLSFPFCIPIPLPISVMPEAQGLYDRVEKLKIENDKDPDNAKIVLISISWAGNVKAEGWPQTEAVIAHCLQAGVPYAIFSFAQPECPQFGEYCLEEVKKRWDKIKEED